MLPAVGWVTARANAVATAASTALPPSASARAPDFRGQRRSGKPPCSRLARARTGPARPRADGRRTTRGQQQRPAASSRTPPGRDRGHWRADLRGRVAEAITSPRPRLSRLSCPRECRAMAERAAETRPARVAAFGRRRSSSPLAYYVSGPLGLLFAPAPGLRLRALAPRRPDPGRAPCTSAATPGSSSGLAAFLAGSLWSALAHVAWPARSRWPRPPPRGSTLRAAPRRPPPAPVGGRRPSLRHACARVAALVLGAGAPRQPRPRPASGSRPCAWPASWAAPKASTCAGSPGGSRTSRA